MIESKPRASTLPDRMVATVAAPFVLGWDLVRAGFFRLCRFMERLDPFEFLGRVVARLAPPLAEAAQKLWARTLSIRLWFARLFSSLYGAVLVALRPLLRAIRPVVSRVARSAAVVLRAIAGGVRRSAVAVHRVVGPTIATLQARLRRISALVTTPVKRATNAVRGAFRRGVWWANDPAR